MVVTTAEWCLLPSGPAVSTGAVNRALDRRRTGWLIGFGTMLHRMPDPPGGRKRTVIEPSIAPTLLGIGPGKSGTIWNYRALRAHPEIYMSPVEGTFHLTREFDAGTEMVTNSLLSTASKGPQVRRDFTNAIPSAPHPRGRDCRPDTRLIVSPPVPVDRAFSAISGTSATGC